VSSLDERVRSLVSAGEIAAAATVAIEALGAAVLRYLRTLHDADDAGDVYQDWAEDLWSGLAGFRGDSTVRTWAYCLAAHASSRFRRAAWRRRRTRLRTSAASRIAGSVARTSPPARPDRLELLMADLPPDDRTLLFLRLDAELSWAEISDVLHRAGCDVRPSTLRKRFERLKARLGEIAREKKLIE
jgi:RNA polymerase sigma-70 factor (ECF subfamily)